MSNFKAPTADELWSHIDTHPSCRIDSLLEHYGSTAKKLKTGQIVYPEKDKKALEAIISGLSKDRRVHTGRTQIASKWRIEYGDEYDNEDDLWYTSVNVYTALQPGQYIREIIHTERITETLYIEAHDHSNRGEGTHSNSRAVAVLFGPYGSRELFNTGWSSYWEDHHRNNARAIAYAKGWADCYKENVPDNV